MDECSGVATLPKMFSLSQLQYCLSDQHIHPDIVAKCKDLIKPLHYDSDTIARFLVGHELNMDSTIAALKEDDAWKHSRKSVPESVVDIVIDAGEVTILHLPDKLGNVTMYVRARLHNTFTLKRSASFVDIMIEIMERMLTMSKRVSGIIDMSDVSWKNLDAITFLRGVTLYNKHYPERLGVCLIIGHTLWFHYMFDLVKPLLGSRTFARIHIVNSREQIQQFIDPAGLPSDCVYKVHSAVEDL